MDGQRDRQLAYSDLQPEMHREAGRRKKANKIIKVLQHYLGRDDLAGLGVLDLGCSTGFIADELRKAGANAVGTDIDLPGLRAAGARFSDKISFLCADGEQLPIKDDSVDIVIFNQIYEHVVNPDAVVAEIHRVLRTDGVAYLGMGNRMQVVEPHHKLPFLSWLPEGAADRYMRMAGKGDHYYERFRTKPRLKHMVRAFAVWDYTHTVLGEPLRFGADDMVPSSLHNAPTTLWRIADPFIPTFIWLATKSGEPPAGGATRVSPSRVSN